MKILLIIILCVLINVLSKYLFRFIEELRNLIKVKKNINNVDFNEILKNIDKEFYNDFDKDDIDNKK